MDELIKGRHYLNKKHRTLYHITGFTRHSETLEILVEYERVEPSEREDIPWSRPIDLFKKKFTDDF